MTRERPKSHIGKSKDLPRPDKQYEKEVLEKKKVMRGNREDEQYRYAGRFLEDVSLLIF